MVPGFRRTGQECQRRPWMPEKSGRLPVPCGRSVCVPAPLLRQLGAERRSARPPLAPIGRSPASSPPGDWKRNRGASARPGGPRLDGIGRGRRASEDPRAIAALYEPRGRRSARLAGRRRRGCVIGDMAGFADDIHAGVDWGGATRCWRWWTAQGAEVAHHRGQEHDRRVHQRERSWSIPPLDTLPRAAQTGRRGLK